MRREGLILAAGRVYSKKNKKIEKKNARKICPTENTPRIPQELGDRDYLEMGCNQTRPTH